MFVDESTICDMVDNEEGYPAIQLYLDHLHQWPRNDKWSLIQINGKYCTLLG